jgi:hypothetical protein
MRGCGIPLWILAQTWRVRGLCGRIIVETLFYCTNTNLFY